jgi:hypothetical protein
LQPAVIAGTVQQAFSLDSGAAVMLCRAACVVLIAVGCVFTADPPGTDEWKYDVLHLKSGQVLRGLVLEEGKTFKIRCIFRKPGRGTVTITESVLADDVARKELLNDDERKQLQQRLDALKREREVLAAHLRSLDPIAKRKDKSGDVFELKPADWPGNGRVKKALSYQSAHFRLVANARPEVVQLAAIHLEQAYAAYAHCLPARKITDTTTTILLTRSLAEYQEIARSRGLNLFNPAFYDPALNQVVCGSDLERLCDELQEVRNHHERLREKMKQSKADLMKVYRGKVPPALLAPMAAADKKIDAQEKANVATFVSVSDRLFTRLYHEAFHAYLNTYVYPTREGPLPHWFNEGLAQIFETAILEVGELRVGHADKDRLLAMRAALANRTLLPLTDVLRSSPAQFHLTFERLPSTSKAQARDKNAQQFADRCYLASWALTFYLTFEKRLLGTKALDDYVHSLKRGTDELLAFRDLVGKPLPQFEKEFIDYLTKLRLDGTTGP